MEKKYIVTFKNTHDAIKAEERCKENSIKITVIPTPTYITLSCGISIRLENGAFEQFKGICENIDYKSIYQQESNEYHEIEL